jgi:hypothetical protein
MTMSYSPPRSYRVDVADETTGAYRTVLDNAQHLVEIALLPFAVILATEFVAQILPGGIFGRLVGALLSAAATLVFGTVFVVRWHRFVLLDESVSGGLLPPGWGAFLLTSIMLVVPVAVCWAVLAFVAVLPPHILTMPLTAIGGIALTLAAMRVALVFPAAAIERPIGFMTAWHWIAGNFWRLFVCMVMCYLPFVVVSFVVTRIGLSFPSIFLIIFQGLQLAVSFLGIGVVASLLSRIYRDIAAEPPPA